MAKDLVFSARQQRGTENNALPTEHGRLVMLKDAEKGFKDASEGKAQPEEAFRNSLWRPGSPK
ncbi:hypothetical protein [Paraburkholderia sacchari]|uniref:hypothetical protein n=1 Tax=Paraburkholderia sacchari TaxID=159450 RepID=UPI000542BCFA|nr:hypothetical protein [Paraburkholderia sacchari]NLP60974.1 hypothetical protein [Paraburkholderia sacchari]